MNSYCNRKMELFEGKEARVKINGATIEGKGKGELLQIKRGT